MNCSVYLFGEFAKGFGCLPDNAPADAFKASWYQCKAPTQIVAHRVDNAMYYSYIRRLSNDRCIGIGVVVNGYMLTELNNLFGFFEKQIERLARDGRILCYHSEHHIAQAADELSDTDGAALQLRHNVELNFRERDYKPLPPPDFSVAKNSLVYFNYEDSAEDIAAASARYGFTVVLKKQDYYSRYSLNYYAQLRKNISDIEQLTSELNRCKNNLAKVNRQKKRTRVVAFLFTLIVVAAGVIYYFYDNLNTTSDALARTETSLSNANDSIAAMDVELDNVTTMLENTKRQLSDMTSKYDKEAKRYGAVVNHTEKIPFIIKSWYSTSEPDVFRVYYVGFHPGTYTLGITRLYPVPGKSSGLTVTPRSTETEIEIEEGYHEVKLIFPYLSGAIADFTLFTVETHIVGGTSLYGGETKKVPSLQTSSKSSTSATDSSKSPSYAKKDNPAKNGTKN